MEKSPKLKETTATYVIAAHGTMLTSNLDGPSKKYYAITIPENVELYTHDELGMCIPMYRTESEFICKNYKIAPQQSLTPAFKFSHQPGKTNKFPELFLTPDENNPAQFYTGITHCIPDSIRMLGSKKKKEIIYSIDANNREKCKCSSIVPIDGYAFFDCKNKYSTYYKNQLATAYQRGIKRTHDRSNKDNLNSNTSNCGPILMSQAVKVIKEHCAKYYEANCVIKIYIFACLVESLVETYDDSFQQDTFTNVDISNYLENVRDFNAIPLIAPTVSRFRFSIKSKVFDFITYKDEYIEYTHELHAEVPRGTYDEEIAQLQKIYRGRDAQDLLFYLQEAINKISREGNRSDINILPEFNKIEFFSQDTKDAPSDMLVTIVYNQIKNLIAQEKAKKLGQGRRVKKTLRKKYKKPKKTKHIRRRRFTHNLKSKKHTKK